MKIRNFKKLKSNILFFAGGIIIPLIMNLSSLVIHIFADKYLNWFTATFTIIFPLICLILLKKLHINELENYKLHNDLKSHLWLNIIIATWWIICIFLFLLTHLPFYMPVMPSYR